MFSAAPESLYDVFSVTEVRKQPGVENELRVPQKKNRELQRAIESYRVLLESYSVMDGVNAASGRMFVLENGHASRTVL